MKTVVVGMSGGVDSSVAAIKLIEQGYKVIGLYMRNWDAMINNDIAGNNTLENPICPQEQDYNDAKEVCNKLNIELHRVDFVKEYWDYVFTYFLEELKLGRTPNPDIMCNKYIKFDMFYNKAIELGADFIATGHYARLENGHLLRAKDNNKDQTYFLSQVSKKQFENVLFPIGDMQKEEVRALADKYNLITAHKKDSTGICFIGERNFTKFLTNYLPNQPGNIVDITSNKIIGSHMGLMNYTIGQRKGLNIGGNETRNFVVGKDLEKNILYTALGQDNEYLKSDSCIIDNLNLLEPINYDKQYTAKFRYRQKDNPIQIEKINDQELLIKYPQKVSSVTPGQSCVIYDQDICIGGGIIKEVRKNGNPLWYL